MTRSFSRGPLNMRGTERWFERGGVLVTSAFGLWLAVWSWRLLTCSLVMKWPPWDQLGVLQGFRSLDKRLPRLSLWQLCLGVHSFVSCSRRRRWFSVTDVTDVPMYSPLYPPPPWNAPLSAYITGVRCMNAAVSQCVKWIILVWSSIASGWRSYATLRRFGVGSRYMSGFWVMFY